MGELKKRISLGEPKEYGFIRPCPHDTIVECDCSTQWIRDIVGEAKKEFPDIWQGMTEKELRKRMNEIVEWKWKWFGSE